jgi:hypothetical protein
MRRLGTSEDRAQTELIASNTLFENSRQTVHIVFEANVLTGLDKVLFANTPELRIVS